jgi:hypothetical protein
MVASATAGLIWFQFGAATAFLATGALTLIIICYFLFFVLPVKSDLQQG